MTTVFFGAGRIVHSPNSDKFCEVCTIITHGLSNNYWASARLVFSEERVDIQPSPGAERVLYIDGGGISQCIPHEYAVQLFTMFREHVQKATSVAVYICFTETGVDLYDCERWPQDETAPLLARRINKH